MRLIDKSSDGVHYASWKLSCKAQLLIGEPNVWADIYRAKHGNNEVVSSHLDFSVDCDDSE